MLNFGGWDTCGVYPSIKIIYTSNTKLSIFMSNNIYIHYYNLSLCNSNAGKSGTERIIHDRNSGGFRGDIAINHGEVFHVKQLLWDVVTSHHLPKFDGPMVLWVWGWIYSFSFNEMTINSEHRCIPTI